MRIHLSNSNSRNAFVIASSSRVKQDIIPAKDGKPVIFKRYISAGEGTLNADLVGRFGVSYAEEIIKGDPEVDLENVGRFIDATTSVLIDSKGDPIFCAPEIFEVIYGVDGKEIERRMPVDVAPTINEEIPLKWTGRLISKREMVRRFAIKRTLQIRHSDGVTFDFLFAMAKELQEKESVMLLASGQDGKGPIVLQTNGTPYRGFLEGRIDGEKFLLLLHLSNMELKRPA